MKPSKYRNVTTFVDDIAFDSKAEAREYAALLIREKDGEIKNLILQPEFPVTINGKRICKYRADFGFMDLTTGKQMVVDVKGMKTPVYRLKKKMVEAMYGITITEVKA